MAKSSEGFLANLTEEDRVAYLKDLNSPMTGGAISRKWKVTEMTVSRHRRDPQIMKIRNKISSQALERAMKKAGIGDDLANLVKRSEEIYEAAAGEGVKGAKKDLAMMIEAMKLQLSVVRTKGEVSGELGGPKEKESQGPPTQFTINALISMPRLVPFSNQQVIEGEVVDAEIVGEDDGEWDGAERLEHERGEV